MRDDEARFDIMSDLTEFSVVRVPARGWAWASHATEVAAVRGQPYFDMHYMLEVGILLSGKLRAYYSRWQVDLEPGDVWLCGVWERHGRGVLEPPYERLCLLALPSVLLRLNLEGSPPLDWTMPFKVPPSQRPRTTDETRGAILALAERACSKRQQEDERRYNPLHNAWYLLLLQELLLILMRDWKMPTRSSLLLQADYATMNRAMEMVLSSRGILRSQEVAKACGMSRNVFARHFKEFVGISFPEFCRRHRLSGVAEQLIRTPDPVKSIARDWGFAHVSHLHRCFFRYYDCSPTEYRRQRRQ